MRELIELAMEIGSLRERYLDSQARIKELEEENSRLQAQLQSLLGELSARYTYSPSEDVEAAVKRLVREHKVAQDGMPATYPREPSMPEWAGWIAWDDDGACWVYRTEPENDAGLDDEVIWMPSKGDAVGLRLKEWPPLEDLHRGLKLELV